MRLNHVVLFALLLAVPSAAGSGARPLDPVPRFELIVLFEGPEWASPVCYESLVRAAAAEAGVPAHLLGRIISAESSWDPEAVNINVNGSRDLGIALLGERWLSDFVWFDNGGRPFDPFDPEEAIPVAARYLARLHRATGNWQDAVMAYNCGLDRVRNRQIPVVTRVYVTGVLKEGL